MNDKIIISDQDDYDFFMESYSTEKVKLCLVTEWDSETEYLTKKSESEYFGKKSENDSISKKSESEYIVKEEKGKSIYDLNGLELSGISQMGESEKMREEQLDLERDAII